MDCSTPSLSVLHHLPEVAHTHVHWVSDSIQPSHTLLPPFPSVLNLSQHQSLSSVSALHIMWPKYWSFSFSISPFSEYSELISFRVDWYDLLDIQETLKSLLQHHDSKASILWHSAFFMVHLPHLRDGFPGGLDGKASAYNAETRVRSLGREDLLEKEMATHSSTLAWKIPCTEESGKLQSMGSQSQTRLSDFNVSVSHLYMTTGKTIALTMRTFVGKVMSLLLNMLCRFVIVFLPRSKRLLISWLQLPSTVVLVWKWSHSVVSNSLQSHGLWPTRLLCPWDYPGKNAGVGCYFLLQGIFPTQGLNLGLLHCRQTLYPRNHQYVW